MTAKFTHTPKFMPQPPLPQPPIPPNPSRPPLSAFITAVVVIIALALLCGCQTTRTYSLGYEDKEGRNASFSVTLEPTRGLKK